MALSEDFSCYNGSGTMLRKAQLRLLDMLLVFDNICRKHKIQYYISGGTCLGAIRHGGFIPWDDDVDIDVWYTDYARLMEILPKELPSQYKLQTMHTDPGFYGLAARLVDCKSEVAYANENFIRRKFVYQGLFVDILPVAPAPSLPLKRFIDKIGSAAFLKRRSGALNDYKTYIGWLLWPPMDILSGIYKYMAKRSKSKIVTHYHASIAPSTPELCIDEIFPAKPLIFEGCAVFGPNNPDAYLRRLYGNFNEIPPAGHRRKHAFDLRIFDGPVD